MGELDAGDLDLGVGSFQRFDHQAALRHRGAFPLAGGGLGPVDAGLGDELAGGDDLFVGQKGHVDDHLGHDALGGLDVILEFLKDDVVLFVLQVVKVHAVVQHGRALFDGVLDLAALDDAGLVAEGEADARAD